MRFSEEGGNRRGGGREGFTQRGFGERKVTIILRNIRQKIEVVVGESGHLEEIEAKRGKEDSTRRTWNEKVSGGRFAAHFPRRPPIMRRRLCRGKGGT